MRRRFSRLLAGLVLAGVVPCAAAIEGYPGDTWGRVSHNLNEETGTGISFFVSQGIDWVELPGDIMVNTFAEYRYARRTKDKTYFDAEGEAVGLDFRRRPFHWGVEYFREDLPEQEASVDVTRAYLNWYYDWYKYMRRRLDGDCWLNFQAFSGSTWGRVRHEFDELEATTVSFYVNQGIDWFDLPGEITFNTFVEARFSYRSKDADYYNAVGPAIGAELQRSPFKLGTDYHWQRYVDRHVEERTWRVYLTWYHYWDLENLAD